jgi:Flp pilus assembly protein TadG
MRIQLMQPLSRDDEGAVAIVVAICSVFLIGLAAFAVDFGNAYATKRQLSVASDAASLAGARAISASVPPGATCNPAALQPVAATAAEVSNSQNDRSGESLVTEVTVECENGQAFVTVRNQRTLRTFFGGVLGADGYTPSTQATAQLFVPSAVSGLRPIAACEASVLAAYQPSASPPVANAFLVNISNESAVCGTSGTGAWGFTNFLAQGEFGDFNEQGAPAYYPDEGCVGSVNASANSGGQAGCQAIWTDDGYGGPVYFPNAAVGGDTGLGGNTGLANSSEWRTAVTSLVDEIILLPVADSYNEQPGIDRLNLKGVVSVRVCSVKLGTDAPAQGTHADCSGRRTPLVDPDLATWDGYKNNEAGIWVVPTDYVTSGIADPSNDCSLGDASCDFAVRAIRLYR